MVRINDQLSIPANELSFELSTSSGPGGQHVNRTQTRVTLLFHLAASQTLNESQKSRLFEHLAGRIDRQGRVRVRCGRHRSQSRNREETLERFAAIVAASAAGAAEGAVECRLPRIVYRGVGTQAGE